MQLVGRKYTQVNSAYRYGFNGQEKTVELGEDEYGALFWQYDAKTGRRWNLDPKPVVGVSDYATLDGNPIRYNDPNGDCPTCVTAGIGALIGGVVSGAIEAGSQLIKDGRVSNWKAVGGAAIQGAVTGAVAGLTGGASLLVTTSASAAANAVGGAVNNAVQGKKITVGSVVKDAALGAAFGFAGKLITNNNVLAKNLASQEGRAFEYGLQNGKVVFDKGVKNSGSFDFVITGGKTLIGEGHFAMSAESKLVKGAGTISLDKGVITAITNWSGHYKPNADQMAQAIKTLTKAGFKFAKDFQKVITK